MSPELLAPWLRLQTVETLWLALKAVLRELLRRGVPMFRVQRAADIILADAEEVLSCRKS